MARLWAILLLFCGTALAQTSSPVAATGSFFGVSVSNLQSSTQWYEQKLGLKLAQSASGFAILKGPGLIVELIEQDGSVPFSKAAPTLKDVVYLQGIFKAGAIVNDFAATLASLKKQGVDIAYGPFAAHDGQPANVIIRDNSGNLIQFFAKE